ncbi:MAG TPA: hypothetical protein VEJ84_08600 [Acidimicrobiales bacterium]|nr:hypothetical protein [Acidimicrobiales bacterium]
MLHIHQLFYPNALGTWIDQDLTEISNGPQALASGLSSFAIGENQYLFFFGADQHVHMPSYLGLTWNDFDATQRAGGPNVPGSSLASSPVLIPQPSHGPLAILYAIYIAENGDLHVLQDDGAWSDQDMTWPVPPGVGYAPDPGAALSIQGPGQSPLLTFVSGGHVIQETLLEGYWILAGDLSAMAAGALPPGAPPQPPGLAIVKASPGGLSADPSGVYYIGLEDQHVHQLSPGGGTWGDVDLSRLTHASPIAGSPISSFPLGDDEHVFYLAQAGGGTLHVHQLFYQSAADNWDDEDLTEWAQPWEQTAVPPAVAGGLSSFAIDDGQHVYYLAEGPLGTLHVHQLFYPNAGGGWIDQDLTDISGGPQAAPNPSNCGLSSFAIADGQHVYYLAPWNPLGPF